MHKLLATTLLAATAFAAHAAEDFPTRTVTLVVPNPPGGLVDTSARIIAEPLASALGKTVVVENKDGGSGNIAYQAVARSKPDGYNLLVSYSAYHVGNPNLTSNLPWAPKDFVPVGLITVSSNVIAVNPDTVNATNLTDFIEEVKQSKGEINYASQGVGSLSHLGTEVFSQLTGAKMTHVPYRGSGAAIKDVLAGNVQVFITTPPSVMGHVQTNKLRALAVTADKRHPMLPDVPTTAEAGLPAYQLESWVGLFAPAGTPQPVIDKLAASVEAAVQQASTQKNAQAAGIEARFEGPDALQARVDKELAYWKRTVEEAGITAE
ncbi:tripartite tricarboxylate transporter substrate binding protein [Bordetella sp. 15P40C-2]|uniref:Bug family tripartite tricarboxylate transporter substrate binding protein n=1 Tax=Bordetella sp. 15P40C-2 TaxID=2572246 RepID=UPI00132846B0|nr:tripartite tricarboxylate transporter substrate binding protein [Bordetella sp. 15P40C-2]MVW71483.1 tripartite tricarboxylate transporter substrate binding protein [Bordetella sp. 15P40C-2]